MSDKPKDGGPAFPQVVPFTDRSGITREQHLFGLSKRELYALCAMIGDWASQSVEVGEFTNKVTDFTLTERANIYYRMADVMLKAGKQ